jgi:hypothetical protein
MSFVGAARPDKGAGQQGVGRSRYRPHQDAPHAPGRAGNANLHDHGSFLSGKHRPLSRRAHQFTSPSFG